MSLRTLTSLLVLGSTLSLGCFGGDAGDDDDEEEEEEEDNGNLDTDGDGLTDSEENELGLDPNLADTDGDGFDDATEVDSGTDGTLCWSVPEGWPACGANAEAAGIEATGWAMGDVVEDWTGDDQYGGTIDQYDLYGMVVVIDMSAGWCGPCRTAAEDAEAEYQHYKDDGVMFMHVIVDDNSYDGAVTDEDFTADWADEYGLTFPVVTDDSVNGYAAPYYNFYMEGYVDGIPAYVVLNRELEVVDWWNGVSAASLTSAIEDNL